MEGIEQPSAPSCVRPRRPCFSTPVVSLSNHGKAGAAVLRQAQDEGGYARPGFLQPSWHLDWTRTRSQPKGRATMATKVKICGLKTEAALDAALDAGADYVGFVFFPPSPRYVTPERAKALAAKARGR